MSMKWEHTAGFGGTRAYVFERETAEKIGSSGLELYAWVRHANGSVLKSRESVWCSFIEIVESKDDAHDLLSLEDLILMSIFGSVFFGVPLILLGFFLYKFRKSVSRSKER